MPVDYLSLGREIKYARANLKMTQEQLALITGLSQSYIALVEIGRRKPSLETLLRCAHALHTTVDALCIASRVRRRPVYAKPATITYIFRYERLRIERIRRLKRGLAAYRASGAELQQLNALAHEAEGHYRDAQRAFAEYDRLLQQIKHDS